MPGGDVPEVTKLWLRGRASILLSEGHWVDCPGLHVEVSLCKILNPKLLPAHCITATAICV